VGKEETIQEIRTRFTQSRRGVVDFWRREHGAHELTKSGLSWLMTRPEEKIKTHLSDNGRMLALEWVEPPPAPRTYTIALHTRGSMEDALMLGEKFDHL